jgi:hypothetical protein
VAVSLLAFRASGVPNAGRWAEALQTKEVTMTKINVILGKVCECTFCKWSGPYSLVISMAGFEFCPSCLHRYTGFMPEFRPTPRALDAETGEAKSDGESKPAVSRK